MFTFLLPLATPFTVHSQKNGGHLLLLLHHCNTATSPLSHANPSRHLHHHHHRRCLSLPQQSSLHCHPLSHKKKTHHRHTQKKKKQTLFIIFIIRFTRHPLLLHCSNRPTNKHLAQPPSSFPHCPSHKDYRSPPQAAATFNLHCNSSPFLATVHHLLRQPHTTETILRTASIATLHQAAPRHFLHSSNNPRIARQPLNLHQHSHHTYLASLQLHSLHKPQPKPSPPPLPRQQLPCTTPVTSSNRETLATLTRQPSSVQLTFTITQPTLCKSRTSTIVPLRTDLFTQDSRRTTTTPSFLGMFLSCFNDVVCMCVSEY